MSARVKELTAAVVGTGFIGPVHVEALRRAGVKVAGIVGSSPEKSRAAAQQLGLPRGYASFDELLRDESVSRCSLREQTVLSKNCKRQQPLFAERKAISLFTRHETRLRWSSCRSSSWSSISSIARLAAVRSGEVVVWVRTTGVICHPLGSGNFIPGSRR